MFQIAGRRPGPVILNDKLQGAVAIFDADARPASAGGAASMALRSMPPNAVRIWPASICKPQCAGGSVQTKLTCFWRANSLSAALTSCESDPAGTGGGERQWEAGQIA